MIKNIVFDWSGTLSDDFEMSYNAVMSVFHELGIPVISFSLFQEIVEIPYETYLKRLFENRPAYLALFEDRFRNDELFREHFSQFGSPQLLKGAKETVNALYSSGVNLAVFSAHHADLLRDEVHAAFGSNTFHTIFGHAGDKMKSYPELLQQTHFDPKETLFVGDTTHDIEVGKAAGMRTCAVLSGYHIKEQLVAANPDLILPSVSALPAALRSTF